MGSIRSFSWQHTCTTLILMQESCSMKCPLKHLQTRKPWQHLSREGFTTDLFSSLDALLMLSLSMVKYRSVEKPCARGARSNASETNGNTCSMCPHDLTLTVMRLTRAVSVSHGFVGLGHDKENHI